MNAKAALLLITSIGAVGGVGYSTFVFSKPKNLKQELLVNKYTLLEKDDTESWTKLTKWHKDSQSNPIKVGDLTIKKIEGLTGITDANQEGIKKLQDKCQELIEKELVHTKINLHREEVKDWCVKESVLLKASAELQN